jgi:hypothetical protein
MHMHHTRSQEETPTAELGEQDVPAKEVHEHWRSYVYAWVFIGIPKILAKKN